MQVLHVYMPSDLRGGLRLLHSLPVPVQDLQGLFSSFHLMQEGWEE